MRMSEHYCIKWNDFNSHLGVFFANLYSSEQHTDVTLRAEGSSFKCHKVVLSASSSYFNDLLGETQSKHPVVILAGVKAKDVEIIIDFMYHGEMKNINYEHFISVLKTAEMLKINGLTEVTIFQTATQSLDDSAVASESDNAVLINDNDYPTIEEVTVQTEEVKSSSTCNSNSQPQDKRNLKDLKKHSDGNIDRALKDMESGMTLMEASRVHKVPRSTLYSKAKHHSSLQILPRKEHSNQDCHPALQAIAGGMSLKRAAEEYSIPKTVLWRRVQKRLDILSKVKCRKKGGAKQPTNFVESRVRENKGNNLLENSVTDDSTLEDSRNNRESLKNVRLSQAVEACKKGKMSQAAASTTYQVPKTTIWRRLQKCSTQDEIKPQIVIEKEDHQHTNPNEYEKREASTRTNLDTFQSPTLIVKPVILFNPNSNSENINNYENCVEISTEEEVCSSLA